MALQSPPLPIGRPSHVGRVVRVVDAVVGGVPAVGVDVADAAAVGEGRHDEDVAVGMCAFEIDRAAGRRAARRVLDEPERDVVVAVVHVLLETEVQDLVAISGSMNCAAYAFMMSILLLTLLSLLHCQSGMSRVSLDPVANVLASTVQNVVAVLVSEQVPFLPCLLWKSRTKAPSLKPVVASKSIPGRPAVELNSVSQSSGGAASGAFGLF